eukprot:TRINITY_DN6025_c0_g1_i1.p1 TRINITY_DN6025_c0_g1~~TRINITY_DN6025_c0_g1_i1.p1  ORF type:complete len:232 (-),score=37.90 TRINITY_DN6025_c0_g1_i1:324-935(-)
MALEYGTGMASIGEQVEEGQQLLQAKQDSDRSASFWRKIAVGSVAIALVVCGAASYGGAAHNSTSSATTMDSTDPCGPCGFGICAASMCDHNSAPFVCTSGGAQTGCAAEASTWPKYDDCDSCCDLSNCSKTMESGDDKELTKKCGPCGKKDCQEFGGYQRCGLGAPYVCTEGSSKYGCASDKYHWAAMLDTSCSACCDMTDC